MADGEMLISNPDDTQSQIKLKQLETDKEMLGVWDNPLGGNEEHCVVVHDKMEMRINRMKMDAFQYMSHGLDINFNYGQDLYMEFSQSQTNLRGQEQCLPTWITICFQSWELQEQQREHGKEST